jgi:PAS domain S-box-containing protein
MPLDSEAAHPAGAPAPLRDASPAGALSTLRDFVCALQQPMIVWDPAPLRVVEANDAAAALYGYRRAELLGMPAGWNPSVPGDMAGPHPFAPAGSDVGSPRRVRPHQRRDGSAIPIEASVSPLVVDGATLAIVTLHDVSAYLEAEADLTGRLGDAEDLLELSTLLSSEDNLERVLERIAEGALRCVGVAGCAVGLPEGDRLFFRQVYRNGEWQEINVSVHIDASLVGVAYRSGQTVSADDIDADPRVDPEALAKSGARSAILAPVKARDGRVLAVLGLHERLDGRRYTTRDIALAEAAARYAGFALERAQAQAELAVREAHYRALMEQAQDAVVIVEPASARVLDANPSALALLGRSLAELQALSPAEIRALSDAAGRQGLAEMLAGGQAIARMRRLWQRSEGTLVSVEVNANYVEAPRGRVLMVVARDISDQIRAEEERERFEGEIRERAREVELLLEITAALNAAGTEEAVLRAVAEQVGSLCRARVSGIGLPRGGHLVISHLRADGVWEQRQYRPPTSGSIGEYVLRTGRAYRSNDLTTDPLSDRQGDGVMGFRTQLSVPIIGANDRVLGVISLHDKVDGSPFTGQDEALAGALAAQTAVALERVRSRQQLEETLDALKLAHGERDVAQRAAEERGGQLGAMVELTTAVAAGRDLDEVFAALAARVAQIAGFDAVALNTYDIATGTVTLRSMHHRRPRTPRGPHLHLGRSFVAATSPVYRGFLVGEGPFVGHGTARSETRGFAGIWTDATRMDLMVSVPLRYEGLLLGDLSFAARDDREVTPDDLRLLEALAGQVALAAHGAGDVARIKQMREDAVFRLAAACEARDPETGLHLRRIQVVTTLLARELGMAAEAVEELSLASVLHDVGKIVVPDAILWKPGKLDPEEFMIVKMHAAQGEAMLTGPEFYSTARAIARHHHERWDGGGYPDGRGGTAIPWAARITAVADVYDALISPRVYKHAWDPEAAAREILAAAGAHFDPTVVEAFESLWRRDAIAAGLAAANASG